LRDGGHEIGGSSSFSCGHCITVCPCNALMEKSMLGEAGFPSRMPKESLNKMIDVVKAIEPELGYGVIMQVSQNGARGWQIWSRAGVEICGPLSNCRHQSDRYLHMMQCRSKKFPRFNDIERFHISFRLWHRECNRTG
jgi:ferredoxin